MIYSFNNDYSEGAHPRILQAMMETNLEQNNGYSLDLHTDHAKELIRQEIGREDADIHMITGGTQTNLLASPTRLSSVQKPVISMSTKREPSKPPDTRFWDSPPQMDL